MTENIESGSGNDATTTDIRVLVREIYRNGWLKVPISPEKKAGALSKNSKLFHHVWVVFCIHDDTEPFLEYYDSQQNVLGHKSTQSWHLGRCLHISPNISLQYDDHMFSLTLDNQILKFGATTQDEMMEWINVIRNKLTELAIFGPTTNLYSKEPESKPRLAPVRDPTSPLPPPPGHLQLPPGTTLSRDDDLIGTNDQEEEQNVVGSVDIPENEVIFRSEIREINTNQSARHSLQEAATDLFTQTEFTSMIVPSSAPPQGSASTDENIFNFNTLAISTSDIEQHDLENSIYEPLHLTTSPTLNSSRNNEMRSEETVERTENLSLKEKQVALLNTQINHPGGIRLRIRRKDCLNSIALGNYIESVWILGWKQRAHPLLYHNFHIGDKIMSVEGLPVKSPQQVHKIIKQTYTPSVEFIVSRVPFGKAFAIKRDYDGQDLGLVRDNNTAEITDVATDGLAARYGLSLKTTTSCGLGLCNWMLTEINGRPLNLFYKGNEIHDRLNAVGKDISILVQPSDFVKIVKKQLKSLRSYKDYIVQ